jgi:SWI/SNF-related matrix-associated actin-dependent regulator 1 of chromatin subfamily A
MQLRLSEKSRKLGLELRPFQTKLVKRMIDAPSTRIYNACEQGLGKTPMSFVYANTIHAENVLYVCPASLRINVARESDVWFALSRQPARAILSGKDYGRLHNQSLRRKGVYPTPLIVSYSMLVTNPYLLRYVLSRTWDLVISDEVDELRNFATKKTNIMGEIWSKCADLIFLSGTPIVRSAADMFPILSTIAPYATNLSPKSRHLLTDFDKFAARFTYIWRTRYGDQYKDIRNAKQLKAILTKEGNFFFRKEKRQVLKELPDKTYVKVNLNLHVKIEDIDQDELDELTAVYEENEATGHSPIMAILRREVGLAIANCKEMYDYIHNLLKDGRSLVLFTWHKDVLHRLRRELAMYKPVYMHGGTSPNDKQLAVDEFQAGKTQLIIGNIISLGKGWTLTRAYDCLFVEVDWLHVPIVQAGDRLHRIGQKNAVTLHFPIVKNEFHQRMMATLIRRQVMAEKLLGED